MPASATTSSKRMEAVPTTGRYETALRDYACPSAVQRRRDPALGSLPDCNEVQAGMTGIDIPVDPGHPSKR